MENICFVVNKYPNEFEPYMLVFFAATCLGICRYGEKGNRDMSFARKFE